MSINKFLI